MSKNITLSVSDDVYDKMKEFSEIKWSEVVRKTIEERIALLESIEVIASKSKLTEKDAFEIGEKIKRGMARRQGSAR